MSIMHLSLLLASAGFAPKNAHMRTDAASSFVETQAKVDDKKAAPSFTEMQAQVDTAADAADAAASTDAAASGDPEFPAGRRRRASPNPPPAQDLSEQLTQTQSTISAAQEQFNALAEGTKAAQDMNLASVQKIADHSMSTAEKVAAETQQLAQSAANVQTAISKAQATAQKVIDEEAITTKQQIADRQMVKQQSSDVATALAASAFNTLMGFRTQADKMNVATEMLVKDMKYKSDVAVSKTELDVTEGNSVMDERLKAFTTKTGGMLGKESEIVEDFPNEVDSVKDLQDDGQKQIDAMQSETAKTIQDIDTAPIKLKDITDAVGDAEDELGDQAEDATSEVEDALKEGTDETNDLTSQISKDVKTRMDTLKKSVVKAAGVRAKLTEDQKGDAETLKDEIAALQGKVAENAKTINALGESFATKRTEAMQGSSDELQNVKSTAQAKDQEIASTLGDEIAAASEDDLTKNGITASRVGDDASTMIDEVAGLVKSENLENKAKISGSAMVVAEARRSTQQLMQEAATSAANLDAQKTVAEGIMKKATAQTDDAVYQVNSATKNANQAFEIKVQQAVTAMSRINEDQRSKTVSIVPQMEEPARAQASELDRETAANISDVQIKVDKELHDVEGQYEKIAHKMKAAGVSADSSEEDEVLHIINGLNKDMKQQQARKEDMEAGEAKQEKNVITMTKISKAALEEGGRDMANALLHKTKESIHKFEDNVFQGEGGISQQNIHLVQLKSAIEANRKEAESKNEYNMDREKQLAESIENEKVRATEENERLENEAARIVDQSLPALKTTAAAAAEEARTAADMTVAQVTTDEKTLLYQTKEKLLAHAEHLKAQGLEGINLSRDELMKLFDKQREAEAAKIALVAKGAEDVTYDADQATQKVTQTIETSVEKATKAAQEAALLTAQTLQNTEGMNQAVAAEGEHNDQAVKSAEKYIAERSQAEVADAQTNLVHKVDGVQSDDEALQSSTNAAIRKVEEDVEGAGSEVTSAKEGAEASAANSEEVAEKAANEAENEAAADQAKLDEYSQQFDQNLQKSEDQFKNAEDRSGQITDAMKGEAGSLTDEAKVKMQALAEEAMAGQKAIAGEINAKYDAAQMTAKQAEEKLEQSKFELDSEKKALGDKMTGVQDELRKKANLTSQEIKAFSTLTETEQNNLDNNVQYLRNFMLMTQSQVLEVLEGVEKTVSGAAAHSEARYDEVEEEEKKLSTGMDTMMNSNGFKALKTIMDADDHVQKATVENSETVAYMNEFKSDLEDYMKSLMKTLEETQYALLLHDNEVKMEQTAIDADAGMLTGNVIGSINALVGNQSAGGEGAQLEGMTAETLKMLLNKAQTGSAQDKEQIRLIMAKIQAQGANGLHDLDNAQHLIDQINAATSGNSQFEAMRADLQKVVEFSEKMNEAERKRMEERGLKLSDHLFFGEDALRTPSGFEHIPAYKKQEWMAQAKQMVHDAYNADQGGGNTTDGGATSLIESHDHMKDPEKHKADPKVQAALDRTNTLKQLLAKNKELMAAHKALNIKHEQLGARVEAEAAKRTHHEQ